ncbi:MAG TPA: hypothetical protein GXZ48_04490 [Acholeplasmataceae bacterium]|nr:hypothetical protein [Acholeplasmataceae bacterium]
MRKPTVQNKYNLTVADIRKLKVRDRSKIKEPLFWRNNVISAWCILKKYIDNEFWLRIYDEDAKAYGGKIRVSFDVLDGMYTYRFNQFFKEKDIENEMDLKIQELALETINQLIDEGILIKPN